jgi:hypothetical protein
MEVCCRINLIGKLGFFFSVFVIIEVCVRHNEQGEIFVSHFTRVIGYGLWCCCRKGPSFLFFKTPTSLTVLDISSSACSFASHMKKKKIVVAFLSCGRKDQIHRIDKNRCLFESYYSDQVQSSQVKC